METRKETHTANATAHPTSRVSADPVTVARRAAGMSACVGLLAKHAAFLSGPHFSQVPPPENWTWTALLPCPIGARTFGSISGGKISVAVSPACHGHMLNRCSAGRAARAYSNHNSRCRTPFASASGFRLRFFRLGFHPATSCLITGRGRPSGHAVSAGQLFENHCTAPSRRPTVMSEPSTRRRYMVPEPKTCVATYEGARSRAFA